MEIFDLIITVLILAPYLAVPLTLTRLYKKRNYKIFTDTYWLSGVIILLYPFLFIWIRSLGAEPTGHGKCYNTEAGFLVFNTIFMLPLTMVIQWASNTTVNLSSNISETDQ